jgi:hypothetical protein
VCAVPYHGEQLRALLGDRYTPGVTDCLSCHGPPPAGGWANVTIVGRPAPTTCDREPRLHGSGCHTTTRAAAGGFRLGAARYRADLNVAGRTTAAGQVGTCLTCRERLRRDGGEHFESPVAAQCHAG